MASHRLHRLPRRLRDRLAWPLTLVLALASAAFTVTAEAAPAAPVLLVVQDHAPLQSSAKADASMLAPLWRGDVLEGRDAHGETIQVWDLHRERGGFVRRSQVHRLDDLDPASLAALLRFVQHQAGHEATVLTLAAAWLHAAPASALQGPEGAALLDALGVAAERLADRASQGTPPRPAEQAALQGHLGVAARLGVKLVQREGEGHVQLCYDGDAFRRVLALPSSSPEQRARAALALTRAECLVREATPRLREEVDQWRADVLDRVGPGDPPSPWHDRLAIRRGSVWASLAWARARRDDAAGAREAADRALAELGRVAREAIDEADERRFHEAALHVNAVRWAVVNPPGEATPAGHAVPLGALQLHTSRLADGQTCVALQDRQRPAGDPLARRCTWGHVWLASASANREGSAVAVAVQPADGWRELWLFHRNGPAGRATWTLQVVPPAPAGPGLGYAELAGWVPGGRQMLVAREASAEGRRWRRFEVVALATLVPERTAFEPDALGAFQRWPDASWRRQSLALR